jgi:hypothetical protein
MRPTRPNADGTVALAVPTAGHSGGETAERAASRRATLGAAPLLVLASSAGLAALAGAAGLSRAAATGADLLFWLGIAALVVPLAIGILAARARAQTLCLVTALGLELYAAKVIYAPTQFLFSDEFAHLRTAEDIQRAHRLFEPNPIIVVSPHFPGLEGLTASLASAAGVSLFTAGTLVIGVARLVGVLALFFLLERAAGDHRLAGVGAAVYAANPNFLYWTAQFSYESLALPLALLALYLLAARPPRPVLRSPFTLAALAVILAVVVTHHLTSYVLVGVLVVGAVVAAVRSDRDTAKRLAVAALVAYEACLVWIWIAAGQVGGYLFPVLRRAVTQGEAVASGRSPPRGLYVANGGLAAPVWERVTGFAAVLVLLAALAAALRLLRGRLTPLVSVLLLVALVYPISLPLRLVPDGQEIANRTSEFVFIGLALTTATAVLALDGRPFRAARPLAVAAVVVVFLGGVTASWAFYIRTPPPETPRGVPLVVGQEHITVAVWARDNLGPDQRFVSDLLSRLALGSYGEEHTVTAASDRVRIWSIFFPVRFDAGVLRDLRRAGVSYLVVDRRLSRGVPANTGIYFDSGERPGTGRPAPIPPASLGKFDGVPGISRVYDSGNIQVYDVRALTSEGRGG